MELKTEETMINNLLKNTGKSIDQWMLIAKKDQQATHQKTVKLLKAKYDLGLFFADLIVHKANGTDANSFTTDELISNQYKGKENLKIYYDQILSHIKAFGDDIEISPKKAYVSLRRKKQFVCLKPATKSRFEIELILKGQEAEDILEPITGAGAMCTHRIKIEHVSQLTPTVFKWIKLAYTKAI